MAEWNDRYRRLRTMSTKELADRLRQQANARLDFLRYQVGMGFEPLLKRKSSGLREPQFFFAVDSVPALCARLQEIFPTECGRIINRAERICRHRFDLLGYRDLDYGQKIDWHTDRVHGKRAPQKPWFKVHYLDFAEVGDSKVTWELNRHQHLVTLAKAFRITGEQRFANELFCQWKDWHAQNPYPMGINWASSLEVAFRSLAWLWVYYLMGGPAAMSEEFQHELFRGLALSGRHIECHLSTYFSPNTHLLGEGAALFFLGTLCPQVKHAERWQQRGWEILQQAADRQVRHDGLHFEQSIYYHVYALDFFIHAAVLASKNEIPIPDRFNRTIERMCEALCILGCSGPVPRLGDDDGGRLFDAERNQQTHLLDPLAVGAVVFGRGDFKSVAAGPREELLWLLGESGLNEFQQLPRVPCSNGSTAFETGGLYILVSDGLGGRLIVDAGPQGADTAGHGHADALSITASIGGHPLLIDPGTFEYVGITPCERNRFRGTRAHNTLVVDGLDQAEPKGPFSWVHVPNIQQEKWINGETFDLFVGSHDGYTRLPDPVVHRRSVFSLKSKFWLVRDQALGKAKHQLDLYWHVDPKLMPIDQSQPVFRGAGTGLSILAQRGHGWSQTITSDACAPAYGRKESHNVVCFSKTVDLPAEFVTLLLPVSDSGLCTARFDRDSSSSSESAVYYRFSTPQEEHHIVFGRGDPWTILPWSSDAEFFYWGQRRDKPHRVLICCNGSYVESNGRQIISSQRKVSRSEVVSIEGEVRVISGDPQMLVNDEAFGMISFEIGAS